MYLLSSTDIRSTLCGLSITGMFDIINKCNTVYITLLFVVENKLKNSRCLQWYIESMFLNSRWYWRQCRECIHRDDSFKRLVSAIFCISFCYYPLESAWRSFLISTLFSQSQQLKGTTHGQLKASIRVDSCVYSMYLGLIKRKENTDGAAEQVRLPPRFFIMSCQSFLSAQQLSSALIPPNLPHLSLLSLFCHALLRRPVSFITSGGIEFLQLSI